MRKSSSSRPSRSLTLRDWSQPNFEAHVARQRGFERGDLLAQPLAQGEEILLRLRPGGDKHRALPVEAPELLAIRGGPGHVRDILQVHDRGAVAGHRGHAHFVDAGVAAAGLQVEAPALQLDRAARDGGVAALDGADDPVERQPELRDPVEIERNADLLFRIRMLARLPDTRHGLEPLAQLFRQVLQPPVTGVGGDEGHLHHRHIDRLDLAHIDAGQAGGQPAAFHVHLPEQVVVFLVRIGAVDEVDADEGESVLHRRADLVDLIELLERVLQRPRHQLLDVGGVGAWVDGHHGKGRDLERRILQPRHGEEGAHAEGDETEDDNERERRVFDRLVGDFHRERTANGSDARRRPG
jgi:hypothetical protein